MPPQSSIQGVTLYCKGEREKYGRPEFELVSLSPLNSIFSTQVCEISQLIGIPIQIMRVHTPAELNRSNPNATYLKIQCKLNENRGIRKHVSFAPDEWQVAAGNVIAVRADKKPLKAEVMQILCDFCDVRMMRVLQDVAEQGASDETAQGVVEKEFTIEAFRAYAEEYGARERKNNRPFALYGGFQRLQWWDDLESIT
jgi:hypothetical protein